MIIRTLVILVAMFSGLNVLSAQVTSFVSNATGNSTDFATAVAGAGGSLIPLTFSTAPAGALNSTLFSSQGITLTGSGIFSTVVNNAGPSQDGTTSPVSAGEGLFGGGNYLGTAGNYSTSGCFTCTGSLTVSFSGPVLAVGLFTIDLYNPNNAHRVTIEAFTGPNGSGTSLGAFTSAPYNFQPDALYFMGIMSASANIQSIVFTDPQDSANGDTLGIAAIAFATLGGSLPPPPPPSDDYSGPVLFGSDNDATTGPGGCFSRDPVNCATGNFTETKTDLRVAKGRGRILSLARTYNALDAATASSPGPLGFGWTHSYASFLTIDGAGNVTVHRGNGAAVAFTKSGPSFTAPSFVIATLVQNGDGTYTFTLPNQRADIFSPSGRLLVQTDRNGYLTTFSYDGSGRVSSITDSSGRSLVFSYGSNGLLASATDPIGRKVSYGYDGSKNLTSVTDPAGTVSKFAYDSSHRIVSMTDPNGGVATNTYDSSNRVISQTDPAGRTTTFAYNSGTTTITDGNGHVVSETFTSNRLTSITRGFGTPSAATTTFDYDAAGNRTSGTDANGHTWHATYDAFGNQLTFTDALGRTTTSTYNARNDLLTLTDPLGVTTTITYDAHGNLTSVSRPLVGTAQTRTQTYQHSDATHPSDITAFVDALGQSWSFVYDANGNMTQSKNPNGNLWTGSYNGIGWLTSAVMPRGHAAGANPSSFTVSRVYSALGQVLQVTDQLGHVTKFNYDPNRNLVTATDAAGHITHLAYDPDNEVIKAIRADGSMLLNLFDAAGNLVGQTDGLGRTTSYGYDSLNRQILLTDPLGRATQYGYDGVGNLLSVIDPSNQKKTLTYDAANQLTGISYSDGITPAVTYGYDLDGQRISMHDGTGTTTYQFDSLHRLTDNTDGAGNHVGYGYDLRGGLTGITYPSGKQVMRGYDAAGRLVSVTDWSGNHSTFAHDEDGDVTGIGYGNGVAGAFGFDRTDRVLTMNYTRNFGAVATYNYTRNSLGQVSSMIGQSALALYSYNSLNQLSADDLSFFSLDHADNLTLLGGSLALPGESSLTYDAANEAVSLNSTAMTYDSRGNRIQQNGRTYAYDQANRLIAFGPLATYSYNGDGLRMRKVVNSVSEAFVWNIAQRPGLLLVDGKTQFIYGPGGRPLEQINADGTVLWFHQDQLGSTRVLTNSAGAISARYGFSSYGVRPGDDLTDKGAAAITPLLFAGQYTDAESGLQYMRARYYDPTTGQFLTRDPLVTITRHPYVYAGGDPVNHVDPTGLDDEGPAPTAIDLPGGGGPSASSEPNSSDDFEGPAPTPTEIDFADPGTVPDEGGVPDVGEPGIGNPQCDDPTGGAMAQTGGGGTISGGTPGAAARGAGGVPRPVAPAAPGTAAGEGTVLSQPAEDSALTIMRKLATKTLGTFVDVVDTTSRFVFPFIVLPPGYAPGTGPQG